MPDEETTQVEAEAQAGDQEAAAAQQATEAQEAADRVKAADQRLSDMGLLEDGSRDAGERAADTADQVDQAGEMPDLTQRQREMAKQAGYSDDEIRQLGDKAPTFFGDMATKYDRARTELGEKSVELDEAIKAAKVGKNIDGARAAPEEDGSTPSSRRAGTAGESLAFVDQDGYLDTEKVSSWGTDINKKVSGLESMLTAILEDRETEQWEQFFNGLDPNVYPQYGKDDVAAGSPQQEARDKLKKEVKLHLRGAAFAKEPMTLRQAQQRLLPAPDIKLVQEAEQRRISKDLERQGSMGLVRRGGRSGEAPALTDDQQAEAKATKRLQAKGLVPV